jgi:hypothetical protein
MMVKATCPTVFILAELMSMCSAASAQHTDPPMLFANEWVENSVFQTIEWLRGHCTNRPIMIVSAMELTDSCIFGLRQPAKTIKIQS